MKERTIVEGLNPVGASTCRRKDFTRCRVYLNLPTIVGLHFDNPFSRSNVEAIDILPSRNLRLRNFGNDAQNLFKRQYRTILSYTLRGRLNPGNLFFYL